MSASTTKTESVVESLKQGGDQAFADLFAAHRPQLRRMVSFRLDPRLHGRVDASDVVQETYLDAAQRVQHFLDNPSMPFMVWLRLIAGQRLIDVHRRHLGAKMRDAGREVPLNRAASPAASSVCLAAHLAGQWTSPSRVLIRAEQQAQLEDALQRMDPIDREVLLLRHFEELTNNEVAEILGLRKAAASNRYVRALKRLKEILEELDASDQ